MDASQNRKEFKFLLSREQLDGVKAKIAAFLELDPDSPDNYVIQSEYFDTDDQLSYWQKTFGIPDRRRIRTRTYENDHQDKPACFIEIKHKQDGLTVKRRIPATSEDIDHFIEEGTPPPPITRFLRTHTELTGLMEEPPRRPIVRIRYSRQAFDSGPSGTLRVTFDTDVRGEFLDGREPQGEFGLLEDGTAIMEVKTIGPVPYWFRTLVGEFSLTPRGFSKYTAALELSFSAARPSTHGHQHVL